MDRRRRVIQAFAVVAVWWAASALAAEGSSGNAIMTQEGRLVSTIELRDVQEGFAGVSGTIWTIEPDGTFKVAQFVNNQTMTPRRQGRLDKEMVAHVAETMVAQRIESLPTEIGKRQPVNARRLILRFDQKTYALSLLPGQGLDAAAAEAGAAPEAPQARFLAIVAMIRSALEGKPQ